MRIALLGLATLLACTRSSGTAPAEEARALLSARCGTCHDPVHGTAKPGALAIFDLSRSD
jgi:hypothetical protein